MANRTDLTSWVLAAINDNGGKAKIVTVANHIWQHHERDLRDSGDLFFTWQYDMRWAAQKLRNQGKLVAANQAPKGIWIAK